METRKGSFNISKQTFGDNEKGETQVYPWARKWQSNNNNNKPWE